MPNNDTTTGTSETPDDAAAAAAAAASAGSGSGTDEVSLLRSRLNGQTAKVGELTNAQTAAQARIQQLEADLAAARGEKVTADEAAKALVEASKAELAAERAARVLEAKKARFPESFALLGDAAAALGETELAANEARLLGDGEPPVPLKHNESKSSAASNGGEKKAKSAADLTAELLAMPVPEGW